jgi:hypothetical protein
MQQKPNFLKKRIESFKLKEQLKEKQKMMLLKQKKKRKVH